MLKFKERTQGNLEDGIHSNVLSISGVNVNDDIQTIIFTEIHQEIVDLTFKLTHNGKV